jgi:hypothetical protein
MTSVHSARCTCLYRHEDWCKYIVATLLLLIKEPKRAADMRQITKAQVYPAKSRASMASFFLASTTQWKITPDRNHGEYRWDHSPKHDESIVCSRHGLLPLWQCAQSSAPRFYAAKPSFRTRQTVLRDGVASRWECCLHCILYVSVLAGRMVQAHCRHTADV